MIDLNKLRDEIHLQCVTAGWWDAYPVKLDRYNISRMLIATEVAEACEGDRKDLDDDHLPQYKMFRVELADTAIRILDTAGALDVSMTFDMERIERSWFWMKDETNAERLWRILEALTASTHTSALRGAMTELLAITLNLNIPLFAIMAEKRDYNLTRKDHQKEVRENAENGKRY